MRHLFFLVSFSFLTNALYAIEEKNHTKTIKSKGVSYFESQAGCPLASVGTRAEHDCHRLTLDDEFSEVAIDSTQKTIVWLNKHSYSSKTIVGDIVLSGLVKDKSGEEFITSVHVILRKKGDAFEADVHSHSVLDHKMREGAIEGWTVTAKNSKASDKVILTPKQLNSALLKVSFAQQFLSILNVKASEGSKPTPETRSVTYTFEMGVGWPKVGKTLLKAEFSSTVPASLAKPTLVDLLKQEHWQFKVTPTSRLVPKDLDRDLFLYSLGRDDIRDLLKGGLTKGQTLSLLFDKGQGSLTINDKSVNLTEAPDIVRAILEFNSVGTALRTAAETTLKK